MKSKLVMITIVSTIMVGTMPQAVYCADEVQRPVFRPRITRPIQAPSAVSPQIQPSSTAMQAARLTVLSPNGGEQLEVGSTVVIRWQAHGIGGRGDLLLQQGTRTVATIARNVDLAAESAKWTVRLPRRAAGSFTVLLRSREDRNLSDSSDRPFTIVTAGAGATATGTPSESPTEAAPSISIIEPAADRNWCTNAAHEFRWSANLPAGTDIRIELLDSMGESIWQTITPATANTGHYQWPGLTDAQFASGLIILRPRLSANDGSISKIGSYLHFGKALMLSKPSSNLTWRQGTKYQIQWRQLCDLPSPLTIELLDSNRQLKQTIAAGMPTSGSSSNSWLDWTVPGDLAPGTYYMRVRTADGQLMRENSFTVAPPVNLPVSSAVTLTSPAANARWCTNEAQEFRWSSTLPASNPVRIDLMDANGENLWRVITANTANNGSYLWQGLSDAEFSSGLIILRPRIATIDNSQVTTGGQLFLGKRLMLSSPSSNLIWRQGSAYQIQWTQLCDLPAPLSIELLNSGRQAVQTIASGLSVAGSSSRMGVSWTVPNDLPPGTYYIRIRTADNQLMRESSFTVSPPSQF